MQQMSADIEYQLQGLRERLTEIRIAKKWLQDFRVNAPISASTALASYYNFLLTQEQKTIAMGKRLKESK